MIIANSVIVNEIISDITVRIQEELNSSQNSNLTIKLGSFLGSKLLAGKGPDIKIELFTVGNIETRT